MKRRSLVIGSTLVLAGVLGAVLGVQVSAHDAPASFPGLTGTGVVDVSGMPARVPVSDSRGRLAGYVERDELFAHPAGRPSAPAVDDAAIAVRDARGRIVGRFTADEGFVPSP